MKNTEKTEFILKQSDGFKIERLDNNEYAPDMENYMEVNSKTIAAILCKRLMWQNGNIVENPNFQKVLKEQRQELKKFKRDRDKERQIKNKRYRIIELKGLLAESDYRAVKYAEGLYTEEEYAPYKAQRQAYRDEINQLEKELSTL